MSKDIFISYKESDGRDFANELYQKLVSDGYAVYFNEQGRQVGNFPEELKNEIIGCRMLILIISKDCLKQLKMNKKVDWIREELCIAKEYNKDIVPLLLPNVAMPKDRDDMPESLRFLPDNTAISIYHPFNESPLEQLIKAFGELNIYPEKESPYSSAFNSNINYDVNEDFISTLDRAKAGDVSAMYEVAIMYYFGFTTGNGTESRVDYKEAAYWLKKVSESNTELSIHADSLIAKFYYAGIMPMEEQSYEKCYEYYEKSKEDKYSAAKLAWMGKLGLGCTFDYEKIKNETVTGDDTHLMELAQFFATYGQFELALETYKKVNNRTAEAEYRIGLLYKLGVHCTPPKRDYIQAGFYLKKAADNKHIDAAYEYAMLSFNPTGEYKKDFKCAEQYFLIAADGGKAEAQYKLGWIYEYGLADGKADIKKAINYYEKAAAQNHILASLQLSLLYQQPGFCNYGNAFNHAKRAADGGCGKAEFTLANLYLFGRGCEANENQAGIYYKRAFEHGIHHAKFMMEKIEKK